MQNWIAGAAFAIFVFLVVSLFLVGLNKKAMNRATARFLETGIMAALGVLILGGLWAIIVAAAMGGF